MSLNLEEKFQTHCNTQNLELNPNQIILVKQLEKPVLWTKSIMEMKNYGVSSFLEVGPGKVLQGLNKRIDRSLNSK